MSIYQLSFESANGEVTSLPAAINRDTDIAALKEFAAAGGYDSEAWGDNHDVCLKETFKHVAVAPSLTLQRDVDLGPFLDGVEEEPALFNLPPEVYEQRKLDGILNLVLDGNGKVVGSINVLPKLVNGIRGKLEIEDLEPAPQVYETGAGWFARQYRGLGIYTSFRRAVLQGEGANDRLIFSQANGKGASHVNIREGWTLASPNDLPFSSALMGWPTGEGWIGREYKQASGLTIALPVNGVYDGRSVGFSVDEDTQELKKTAQSFLKNHNLSEYYHLWVNDLSKAKRFEDKIREGLRVPKGAEGVTDEVVAFTYNGWLSTIGKSLSYEKYLATSNGVSSQQVSEQWDEFVDESPQQAANNLN